MNYISPFDDYPIHQAIEPITIPGPTDRNFYDRYFFNGMDPEQEYIFEIGIGLYPNRHVIDAHFSISFKGKAIFISCQSTLRSKESSNKHWSYVA